MIPIPPHVVRGQVLTADLINRILDALRALRPIQGQGILLKETPQGVVIEATAKTEKKAQAAEQPTTHLPFELRIRSETETIPPTTEGGEPTVTSHRYLDIYAPQGVYYRLLNANLHTRVDQLTWFHNAFIDLGDGWHSFGDLEDLVFEDDGQNLRKRAPVFLMFPEGRIDGFYTVNEATGTHPRTVVIGNVYRTAKQDDETSEETYDYALAQSLIGAFALRHEWVAHERVFVAVGTGSSETLTDDLDAVRWTRETEAYICRMLSLVLHMGDDTAYIENPSEEIPTGEEDGKQCFAAKIAARAHAADHVDGFIPYDEEEQSS